MEEHPPRRRRLKDQRRVALAMRITPKMRDRLVAAAQESGHSISAEGERRLEMSFMQDALITRLEEKINRLQETVTQERVVELRTEDGRTIILRSFAPTVVNTSNNLEKREFKS